MRSLSAIKTSALKKSSQQGTETAHIIKVKARNERVTVSGSELSLLKINKVSSKKRKQLADLNSQIDKAKVKQVKSGEDVIAEAGIKAKRIINKAQLAQANAEKISKELADQLVEVDMLKQKSAVIERQNNTKCQELKDREDEIQVIESKIALSREKNDDILSKSKDMGLELSNIVLMAVARLESIELLADTDKLDDITAGLRKMITAVSIKHSKLSDKEDHISRKDKQLNEKEAKIKEQRTQLDMAVKEIQQNGK